MNNNSTLETVKYMINKKYNNNVNINKEIVFIENPTIKCNECNISINTNKEYLMCPNKNCYNFLENDDAVAINHLCDDNTFACFSITNTIEDTYGKDCKFDCASLTEFELFCFNKVVFGILHSMVEFEPNELSSTYHDNIWMTYFIFYSKQNRDNFCKNKDGEYTNNIFIKSRNMHFTK